MSDFTLNTYRLLLESLKRKGYNFITFEDYLKDIKNSKSNNLKPFCILRHDVDAKPLNSLALATIEHNLNIEGTYYFRIVPKSFDIDIIRRIVFLGHEIGYHYEDVDLVLRSQKSKVKSQKDEIDKEKMIDLAYESFYKHLEFFRSNFDIKTICMHGSPLSKYDNKIIWEKYNYKDLGLLGEPYYDIDFNEFAYFTDTGRRWNGRESSVRDKVNSKFKFDFRSTKDIIDNLDKLPDKVMFTIHPQRWHNNIVPWLNEYFSQNIKNVIKKYYLVSK